MARSGVRLRKGEVIEGPDGTIAHAEMHLGPGTIMPKSPMAETQFAMKSPRTLGGINQCLYVAVEDPDAHYERTKAAGAEIIMEPFDTDYGARNYCARDLEGHLWSSAPTGRGPQRARRDLSSPGTASDGKPVSSRGQRER